MWVLGIEAGQCEVARAPQETHVLAAASSDQYSREKTTIKRVQSAQLPNMQTTGTYRCARPSAAASPILSELSRPGLKKQRRHYQATAPIRHSNHYYTHAAKHLPATPQSSPLAASTRRAVETSKLKSIRSSSQTTDSTILH